MSSQEPLLYSLRTLSSRPRCPWRPKHAFREKKRFAICMDKADITASLYIEIKICRLRTESTLRNEVESFLGPRGTIYTHNCASGTGRLTSRLQATCIEREQCQDTGQRSGSETKGQNIITSTQSTCIFVHAKLNTSIKVARTCSREYVRFKNRSLSIQGASTPLKP